MYGDGEIVVSFENVHSDHAPVSATIFVRSSDRIYEAGPFTDDQKPGVALAQQLITAARQAEARA